jgi:DNA modification methylase
VALPALSTANKADKSRSTRIFCKGWGSAADAPPVANPGNVIDCKAGGGNMGDRLAHDNEAPFPEYLVEFFIRSFCPPAGVACDCFAGSGTTGKMAVLLGRRFVGCDVRLDQVELARRRISLVQPKSIV